MAAFSPVKLRARDPEDMQVIGALLQDALVPLADLAYLKRNRRFVMVANRFRWEAAEAPLEELATATVDSAEAGDRDAPFEAAETVPPHERVNCGIRFDKVANVRTRGLNLRERDQILNLLAVVATPRTVTFMFSGDAEIRLDLKAIDCHMEDLGEPWPTHWRPQHKLDD